MEDSLDKFDKMGDSPAEPDYEDLNEQLKNAVLIDRERVSLTREVISASSVDEYKAKIDNFTAYSNETIGKGVSTVRFKMVVRWGFDNVNEPIGE